MASASASPTSSLSTTDHAEVTQSPKKSNTAAIAAGVIVPISLIAIATAVFFVLRRRKQQSPKELAATDDDNKKEAYGSDLKAQEVYSTRSIHTGQSEVYELKQDTVPMKPVEIGGSVAIHEMH